MCVGSARNEARTRKKKKDLSNSLVVVNHILIVIARSAHDLIEIESDCHCYSRLGQGEIQRIFYHPLPLESISRLSSLVSSLSIMDALSSLPSVTDEDVDALMERLSTQFGDLDLKNLFLSSSSDQSNDHDDNDGVLTTSPTSCLSSSSSSEQSESADDEEEEEEEEPTPEQLEMWQATQFEKGKYKKISSASRSSATNSAYWQQQQQCRQKESDVHEDDWEQIVSLPDLQGQTSHFFFSPASATSPATTNIDGIDQQDFDKLDNNNNNKAFVNVSMLEHQNQLREGDDDSVVFVSSPSTVQQKKASPAIPGDILPPTKRFDLHDLCQIMPEILGGDHDLLNKGGGATSRKSWKRLYSSYEGDGLSLRALWYELRGYAGPTVLLLECIPSKIYGPRSCHQKNSNDPTSNKSSHSATSTTTVGFFTMDTWNEPSPSSISSHKSTFFGKNDDCFLFGIDQGCREDGKKAGVKVIRPRSRASSATLEASLGTGSPCHSSPEGGFMYYRNGKNGKATDGAIHGIGVGGNSNQPRLHLTESLEGCRALPYDTMFEDGDILSPKTTKAPTTATCPDNGQCDMQNATEIFPLYFFDVVGIEVWGVGGQTWIEEALEARELVRGIAASHLRKRQTIKDKHVVYQDLKSGLMSTSLPTSHGATSFFDPYYPGSSTGGRCDV